MKTNFQFLLKIHLALLIVLCAFQTNAQTLPGTYTTSWAGNSFVPSSNNDFIVQGWANSMFVDTDGTLYANSYWDEAARELGIYKNGQCTEIIPNQHSSADGGAITVNADYVWATEKNGQIARFPKTCLGCGTSMFTVSTLTIKGLAASATELFVSDMAANQIKVYSASTNGFLRSWAVTRPGPLAIDASGNVWVLTYDANVWGPGTGACIKAYTNTGTLLKTVTLAAGVQAKSIAIDKTNNELLVTDIGDNMQVHIYNNINGTPTFAQSFGTQGGILSGTKGLVAPLKFNVPNLVGVDASHNIIIWSNGNNTDVDKTADKDGLGSCVESYTRAGVRNWQMLGLEFVDMGTFDPATDGADLYTKHEHFTMDYSKPDGKQWTWKGWTLDRKKYSTDKRTNATGHLSTTLMKRIQGKLYMYLTDMYSAGFYIYRFDNANEGEIAIPCGILDQWQNMWIDANGNGQIDGGENSSTTNIPQEECWGKNVDKAGTIWRARVTGGIYNYPVQSINSYGVPVYSATSAQVVATPAPFTDLRRIYYDSDNDVMYLTGYTSTLKNTTNNWGIAGRVLARYNNWSTGNRTAAYTNTSLPYNTTTSESAVSFTVEGSYIFVCGVASRGKVWVYNTSNGSLAGTLEPGANVGGVAKTGWCDLRNSIAAFKKSTGEYLVTVEEDGWEKILIYRWNPGTSNIGVTGVTISPTSATVNVATTIQLTKTVAPSNATNSTVNWSSSNTAIATVNTSGLVTSVAVGSATITVTTVDGGKTATCAVSVTNSLSKLTGIVIGTTGSYDGVSTRDKAFDGNTATYFDAASANGNWTGLNLNTTYQISSIKFFPRATWENRMVGGKFQASTRANFSSSVVDLYTISTTPTAGWNNVTVTNTTGYRYVRFLSPNGGYGNVAEIEFYGTLKSAIDDEETTNISNISNNTNNQTYIYPNPVSGMMHILNSAINANIKIFSIEGKLVSQFTNTNNNALIDVSDWNKGLYILNISSANGVINTKFIVK